MHIHIQAFSAARSIVMRRSIVSIVTRVAAKRITILGIWDDQIGKSPTVSNGMKARLQA